MNTLKRYYTPPKMDVSEVELESTICSGSVFSPEKQDITINEQKFNTNWDAAYDGTNTGGADFSNSNWDDISK